MGHFSSLSHTAQFFLLTTATSKFKMKVLLLSFLLVDVLLGSYTGERQKCNTVTRDVCTDTVVKECDDPRESVNTATECHSEYETKCHTVSEFVCHDETFPVCETKLDNVCHTEQKTERDVVTRTQCDTVYNEECFNVPETVCNTVQV